MPRGISFAYELERQPLPSRPRTYGFRAILMSPNVAHLRVSTGCAAQMLTHVERALPNECVGFLAGVGMDVSLVIPLPNSRGPRSFFVEPCDQYLAEKRIRDNGLDLIAVYHSHPGGCACLSETDLRFADLWDCVQVVISTSGLDGQSTQVKAYRVSSGQAATELRVLLG